MRGEITGNGWGECPVIAFCYVEEIGGIAGGVVRDVILNKIPGAFLNPAYLTLCIIFGVIGYRSLPISNLPNVDFPTIQVTTQLPGASAETMASAVSRAPGGMSPSSVLSAKLARTTVSASGVPQPDRARTVAWKARRPRAALRS